MSNVVAEGLLPRTWFTGDGVCTPLQALTADLQRSLPHPRTPGGPGRADFRPNPRRSVNRGGTGRAPRKRPRPRPNAAVPGRVEEGCIQDPLAPPHSIPRGATPMSHARLPLPTEAPPRAARRTSAGAPAPRAGAADPREHSVSLPARARRGVETGAGRRSVTENVPSVGSLSQVQAFVSFYQSGAIC